jgi:small-conductance mechanosensitive channel
MNTEPDNIASQLSKIIELINEPILKLGGSEFSLLSIFLFLLAIVLLFTLASLFRKILVYKILVKRNIDLGVSIAVGKIINYIIITIGLIIIFQSTGIDLSSITILFGALGVGIGFGLQHITNNFISGIIILFERPIKVGDRIEVGGVAGDVMNISARATTILTNDNITVIVPNSEFMNSNVINWSHNDRSVRISLKVGVSYKEDPDVVREILTEVAMQNDGVLKYPQPQVLFSEYGDSSLDFLLRVWTLEYTNRPQILKSNLYYEIFRKFREKKIEIPYPQRDVHLKSGFESLKGEM